MSFFPNLMKKNLLWNFSDVHSLISSRSSCFKAIKSSHLNSSQDLIHKWYALTWETFSLWKSFSQNFHVRKTHLALTWMKLGWLNLDKIFGTFWIVSSRERWNSLSFLCAQNEISQLEIIFKYHVMCQIFPQSWIEFFSTQSYRETLLLPKRLKHSP